MAREYVAGTYASGATFDGYFDIDASNSTVGGSITTYGRTFAPGRAISPGLYFENTTFTLQQNDAGGRDVLINTTPEGVGGERVTYDLRFSQDGMSADKFSGGTYRSVASRTLTTDLRITETEISSSQISPTPIAVCFVAGTRIETVSGAVAVEHLRPGDIAVTASGAHRPVRWIGHRTIEARPICISAGAFGDGLPCRALYLSPGHPVLVGADGDGEGGALVPIMCLENGTSIARTVSAPVTYWHVELDEHDVLLAEGLPAESYIDGGDRAFFTEASDHALHHPDFIPPGWGARCRPVVINGPLVEAERLRINALFAASLDRHSAWPTGELVL